MKKLLILIFLALHTLVTYAQSNMETGKDLYNSFFNKAEKYWGWSEKNAAQRALPYLQAAAKEGYGEACYMLGNMYYHGKGVAKDVTIAINMYKKGLELGHDEGEAELGDILLYDDKDENDSIAVYYYKKSMNNGVLQGKHQLALCCFFGWGIKKDIDKAYELICRYLQETYGGKDGQLHFYLLAYFLDHGKNIYDDSGKLLSNEPEVIAMLLSRTNRVGYMNLAAYIMYQNNLNRFAYYRGLNHPSDCNFEKLAARVMNSARADGTESKYNEIFYLYAKMILKDAEYNELTGSWGYHEMNYGYTPISALEVAAGNNYYEAAEMLSRMYKNGVLVSKNIQQSNKYHQMAQSVKFSDEYKKLISDTAYRKEKGFYMIGDTYIYKNNKYIVAEVDLGGKPWLLLPLNHTVRGTEYSAMKSKGLKEAENAQYYQIWIYMDDINAGLEREGANPLNKLDCYAHAFTFKSGFPDRYGSFDRKFLMVVDLRPKNK